MRPPILRVAGRMLLDSRPGGGYFGSTYTPEGTITETLMASVVWCLRYLEVSLVGAGTPRKVLSLGVFVVSIAQACSCSPAHCSLSTGPRSMAPKVKFPSSG